MSKTITEQLQLIKQQDRLGLMTHVVLGYPSLAESKDKILRMVEAGVDCIELQIPFSDPMADGPVITVANQVALQQGVTVEDCFALAAELIPQSPIPLQFIGYYNTVYHFGVAKFVERCRTIGIAGLTFPDLPIAEAEYEPLFTLARAANIPMIQLVSPASTPDRLRAIAKTAKAMVYCVARFGVTGTTTNQAATGAAAQLALDRLTTYLQTVRQYVTLPLAVGFGLRQPSDIAQLRGLADVAVVGSALQNIGGQELSSYLKTLCASR